MTRKNVSNHLTCLRGCGVIMRELRGGQVGYEIADRHLASVLTALVDLLLPVVLSRLLGISISTACEWAAAVGSSTASYAADRGDIS